MLEGIDVSGAQGVIDWQKVKESKKIAYAFCKATEGNGFLDKKLAENWKGIDSAELIRGAYHFGRPDARSQDAKIEADMFVDAVLALNDLKVTDMFVLDIEASGTVQNTLFVDWVIAFVDRVEERTSKKPIIYTGGPFFDLNSKKVLTKKQIDKLASYPLWLSAYVNYPDNYLPVPWKTKGWTIWQKSGNLAPQGSQPFKIPGVNGVVDYNLFKGTREDFEKFALSLNTQKTLAGKIADKITSFFKK